MTDEDLELLRFLLLLVISMEGDLSFTGDVLEDEGDLGPAQKCIIKMWT